jgi:hypothetical protein
VYRSRAEIPENRISVAGQQRPAREFIAFPFTDFGGGQIPDVIHVKQQQSAKFGGLERLFGAANAIVVQPPIIHPLLKIDAHCAKRWKMTAPVVARLNIVGSNGSKAFINAQDSHLYTRGITRLYA